MKRQITIVAVLLILLVFLGFLMCRRSCGTRIQWPCMLSEKSRIAAHELWRTNGVCLGISEPAGMDRKSEPVTSGVPLPEGAVDDVTSLRLLDGSGKRVPCQFTPLSRWPSPTGDAVADERHRSIKWVLLDFQADVAATNRTSYRLTAGGRNPPPTDPVKVVAVANGLKLETKRLKMGIVTNLPGLIHSIALDGRQILSATNPVEAVLVGADDKIYRISQPAKVVSEDSGPLRATVLLQGQFVADSREKILDGKVGYDLRITAYAGKPFVKLAFTLKNDGWYGYRNEHKSRQWLYFKSLRIDFPLTAFGTWESAIHSTNFVARSGQPLSVVQWYNYPYKNDRGQEEMEFDDESDEQDIAWQHKNRPVKGPYVMVTRGTNDVTGFPGRVNGWVEIKGSKKVNMALAVRRFWQNFPRGFAVHDDRLSYLIFPPGGFWPRTQAAHDAKTYQFEGGRHKTTEFILSFDGSGKDAVTMLDSPLFARAEPAWYRNTGCVLPLANPAEARPREENQEALARYDRIQRAYVHIEQGDPAGPLHGIEGASDIWDKVSIPSLHERAPEIFCGWMNYGDLVWSFGYCSLYYEWPYAMLQQYLRLNDREFFDLAEDMIRHRYDIDQYHVENTEPYLGGFQRYEKGEHGNLPRQKQGYGEKTANWEMNAKPSHTWNRDLLLHWALTGDPRSLDAAEQNGRAFERFFRSNRNWNGTNVLEYTEFRTPGWAIEACTALYEYTGKTQWLAFAEQVFDKTLSGMEKKNGREGSIIKGADQTSQFVAMIVEPVCRLHHCTGRKDVAEFLDRVLTLQREKGSRRGIEKDGKYYPTIWLDDWEENLSLDDPVAYGAWSGYGLPMLDGYAYLGHVLGKSEDLDFARKLFRENMFYYGLKHPTDPKARSPLGFHYWGTPLANHAAKVHAWFARYGQVYMTVDQGQ